MALYKVTKKQSGGGTSDLVLKRYAYIPGDGIGIYIRDRYNESPARLKPLGNRTFPGEISIKFYETAYSNGKLILSSDGTSAYGPSIRVTSNNFQFGLKADSSSLIETVPYSVGAHEMIFNRYSDHKNIFDNTELTNNFDEGSSGSRTLILFGSSYTSNNNMWAGYFEEFILKDKSGNVCYDIVPAEFKGDACLYDKINNDFYYYCNMQVMDEIPTT